LRRMRIAILDPAAGISGDMTLGALLALGAPQVWLEGLPGRLGLAGVGVTVRNAVRCGVACKQVEFTIPEQPHGRHVGELVRLVERAPVSDWVKQRAIRAFRLVGEAEGEVHGVAPEKVHLHEVGAVDAVLDIVGAIEGFEQLGVETVYAWPVAVGNGWVERNTAVCRCRRRPPRSCWKGSSWRVAGRWRGKPRHRPEPRWYVCSRRVRHRDSGAW